MVKTKGRCLQEEKAVTKSQRCHLVPRRQNMYSSRIKWTSGQLKQSFFLWDQAKRRYGWTSIVKCMILILDDIFPIFITSQASNKILQIWIMEIPASYMSCHCLLHHMQTQLHSDRVKAQAGRPWPPWQIWHRFRLFHHNKHPPYNILLGCKMTISNYNISPIVPKQTCLWCNRDHF